MEPNQKPPVVPNAKLLEDETIPRITLAGKEWPVPKLAIAQNIVIFPIIVRRCLKDSAIDIETLRAAISTEEGLRDVTKAIFVALQRGHEGLRQAEFDQWPIAIQELMPAFLTVAIQTSIYGKQETNGVAAHGPLATTAPLSLAETGRP
jgi:hypothetical protein